ncbi:hypothetical protein ACI3PL_23270, partial [Lacticaseibacillus paracasei]
MPLSGAINAGAHSEAKGIPSLLCREPWATDWRGEMPHTDAERFVTPERGDRTGGVLHNQPEVWEIGVGEFAVAVC